MILFMAPFIRQALQHPVLPLLGCLVVPVAAGIAARLAVLGAEFFVLPVHAAPLVVLLVEAGIATLIYAVASLACARRRSLDLLASVRRVFQPAMIH